MSEDILADWKNNKFIVAPAELVEGIDTVIVLTDIKFWAAHADELHDWCEENGLKTKGMTVEADTEEKLSMFLLRWS